MTIRLYDKSCYTIFRDPKPVVRAEVQLRTKKLEVAFTGGNAPVTHLDFQKCYAVFRKKLLKFHPETVPRIGTKDEALHVAAAKGFNMYPLIAGQMSRATKGRFLKSQAQFIFKYFKVDWAKLLPAKNLPPVVEPGERSTIRIRIKRSMIRKLPG